MPPRAPPTRPRRLVAWVRAARPKTLPAAVVPVVVGSAYAWRDAAFQAVPAAAALAGALLLQIGANYANDYYDHRRGADRGPRLGPPRATASGWIPAPHVLSGAAAAFGLAALVGLYLILHAGWPILIVGLASIAFAYAYTGGPYPLGYHGWGEALVFVFFGLVAVAGTYYVQAGPAPPETLVAGAGVGALAAAILVVNNLRDLDGDRAAGKRTLAVRLGANGTRLEYALLLALAFLVPPLLALGREAPTRVLLPLASLPLGLAMAARIARTRDPRELNEDLARTALLLVLYGFLLAVGVAWGAAKG